MVSGMALTDADLTWIRDEIGTSVPPGNGLLEEWFDELGSRAAVALRVLKRRRADLAGAEVASVSLAGVASVQLRSNIASLDRQIGRLEGIVAGEGGEAEPEGRVTTMRRSWR
jgi:hypothetical protein